MKHLLCLALALSACSLFAQTRYLQPVFNQVTRTNNVVYGKNATVLTVVTFGFGEATPQPLVLHLYEPTGDTLAARPLVLVLPGGFYLPSNANGWCDGTLNDSSIVETCTRLAKLGYVAAAVDFREGWYASSQQVDQRRTSYLQALYRGVQDARTAIRFFKKTVAEEANPFRVDTSRIVVWGESTGGEIALGAAYANAPDDWTGTNLNTPGGSPIIDPAINGNIWGTDVGVVPAGYCFNFPQGDTLCTPNWPGYSSAFQLCVSLGGDLPQLPWVGVGEMPAILFHAPNDGQTPCGSAPLNTPTNLPIIAVSGSCALAAQLDAAGDNQIFWQANINDCVSNQAMAANGGFEGFFPFTGLAADRGRPWQWGMPCPGNPNLPTDPLMARQYFDTIFAYFAPRACAALALGNVQPDPAGLCGTQVRGKVFLDGNQNSTFDLGEQTVAGVVIEMQPGGFHASSGITGNYSIAAPPGDYILNIPNPPAYFTGTNIPVAVTIPALTDTVQDLPLLPTGTVNDLQVFMTASTDPRPGFPNKFSIVWKNVGTTALSGTVTVAIDDHYVILNTMPVAGIAGNVVTFTFENLLPLHQGSAMIQVNLPATVAINTAISSNAVVEAPGTTDQTPDDNYFLLEQRVVGSFDPNDKRVVPEGQVTDEIFEAHGQWLDYTVRFQNTGNASAINVHIVDTLQLPLNINTLEIIAASHPVHWEVSGQRTLTFYFDNIQLPDSVHDEPGSHGFVRYRIQPRLPYAELVKQTADNFADIYFDFNAPVRTNTAETFFVWSVGVHTPPVAEQLHIAPNPAGDVVRLSWRTSNAGDKALLRVVNAAGKEVYLREIAVSETAGSVPVMVTGWPAGLYFAEMRTEAGTFLGRFVK